MIPTFRRHIAQTDARLSMPTKAAAERAFAAEIVWPSGERMTPPRVAANQSLVVREGQGIVSAEPVVFARAAPGAQE
jgi:hypothetical protein